CCKNSVSVLSFRGFSLSAALAELDSVKKKKRITTQPRMGRSLAGQLRNDGNTTKLIFNDLAGSPRRHAWIGLRSRDRRHEGSTAALRKMERSTARRLMAFMCIRHSAVAP